MATISKTWGNSTSLVATDFYGGVTADLAADGEYDYTADVDLESSGFNGAHITIAYMGSNLTDDLIVDIFGSLDGSVYDTEAYQHYQLENDGTPSQASIIVMDLAHFRISVKTVDTNTTFDYSITYQPWRLNLSDDGSVTAVDNGTAQPCIIITNASADQNTVGANHACKRVLIRAHTINTGLVWVDFNNAAVDLACYPLDAGDAISVPLTNTNLINCLFKVMNEKVTVVYMN